MTKQYLDLTLKARAYQFNAKSEEWFLDQVRAYGYTKSKHEGLFDLLLDHDDYQEAEIAEDEYFVVFPDNSFEIVYNDGELMRKYDVK